MEQTDLDVLKFLDEIDRNSGTGKKKRTRNRLADEIKAFYAMFGIDNPPPEPIPIAANALKPEAVNRRQVLLNHIANASPLAAEPLSLLYTVVIQQFLADLGIQWPEGVFKENPSTEGSGRKRSPDRVRVQELREQGLGRSAIAKTIVGQEAYAALSPSGKKKARDKVSAILRSSFQGNRSKDQKRGSLGQNQRAAAKNKHF